MKLVHAERQGEAFDSQLVIGVRESYGKTDRVRDIQEVMDELNTAKNTTS